MSTKFNGILFLIAVLVLGLFTHMLISCRNNYVEGMTGTEASTTTPTTTPTATPTTNPLPITSATKMPDVAGVPASTTTTTMPSQQPNVVASPTTASLPTTLSTSLPTSIEPTATAATKTEGFSNIFSTKYASPYWNNNSSTNIFAHTKFRPDCCSQSAYSNSSGCACMSHQQEMLLKNRGQKKYY
jgi:hypothetical protein